MRLMKRDVLRRDVYRNVAVQYNTEIYVRRLIEHAVGVLTAY